MSARIASAARPLIAAAVVFAGALLGPRVASAAPSFDPFRKVGAPGSIGSLGSAAPGALLNPFRVADATPPPAGPTPEAKATTTAPTPTTTTTAAPAPSCRRDEDCPDENICQANACQPIQVRTNVAYLYYREGAFREAMLLYWSRKGNPGFTLLAPFYWHFWSPTSEARVVAPFYWRFEDRVQQRVVSVIVPILPVSWTRQPGASSFAVWPLFYTSTKFGTAIPLLGTFEIDDPYRRESYGAVWFLYWWSRKPDRARDLVFPLLVSSRTPAHAFTYAIPLNFYWRHADDANTLALPFFYLNTHATGSLFVSALGYAHRNGAAHSGAAAWLYWFGGDDKEGSRYDVGFPLLWSFRDRTSNTTVVFPLVVHTSDHAWSFDTVLPLWWSSSDGPTGHAFKLLLPFFYWHRNADDKTALLVTPLGGYHRDDREGTRGWLALPLLSLYHRDPDRELRVLTPFYASSTSRGGASVTRSVGLLFYRRVDPDGSTTMLFPLFWRFRDAATGSTATALFPLFVRRDGPRDTTTFVGPFYWRRFTNGGWGAGLAPLAFFGDNAGRSHAVVFPLYWHFADARTSTTAVLPVFYWRRDKHGYDSYFPPLVFVGSHDGDSYAVQFPLLWHFASARQGWSTTATPLGYAHRDRDGFSLAVGPLLPLFYFRSGREQSHFALVPVVWHFEDRAADRTTTVVGPYWHRRWGGETTDGLFPLLYFRRGARPGGGDETSVTVFPFVHYRRDAYTRLLVTPLGGFARGPRRAAGFVGPYFWYRDARIDASFIPFLHVDVIRHDTGERTRQYGPWFQIDAPGHKARALFPIFGHYADADESDTWVVPTYYRLRRRNGDAVDALLPVFWRSSFAGRTTTVIGPYYDRRTPDVHDRGVVPLFFRAHNAQRTITVIPPLLFLNAHSAAGDRTTTWCALYFHTRDPAGSTTNVFPLYWASDRDGRRHHILFPLLWHFADPATDTESTLVGPVYSAHAGTRRTSGLLPIAWFSRDTRSGEAVNVVAPVFYQSHGRDHWSFLTLIAGYRSAPLSRLWYVWPLLHADGPDRRFSMLAPLWFSGTDKRTDTTTTVIPPLLYVSRGNPEAGLTTVLGLFWRHHDIASSTAVGLPLYFDVHDYHLSRLTVLFPLFARYRNEPDRTTTWIAPLFYRNSTPTDVSMVAFPLVWDFKRGDDRTTVVFPFYAHWRRPSYDATYVFPTYFYREGRAANGAPDGTYRRFVLPFYDSGVKRRGDFMWEVLGGLFGHERIGRHNYLRLFYFTVETEPVPRAQTAWYSQPARTPRRNAPRGLRVAGW